MQDGNFGGTRIFTSIYRVQHFRQRINGNILYRFIRKWFCVWSFQRYNQYDVINHQHNNENPLY